jgi:hypothetical protein
VAPGPGTGNGPGGTSKLPYSDVYNFSITARIANFGG